MQNDVTFPEDSTVSSSCKDLILQLLVKDETKRLGSKFGAEEIKMHPFFKDIKWQLLHQRSPPWVPRTAGKVVTGF